MEEKDKTEHFKLHVHSTLENEPNVEQKRSVKTILKDASRQIIVSLIILVVGFFLLNASAYYKVFKSEWEKFSGTEKESPLQELVKEDEIVYDQKTLKTSVNPEIQKKQIPALELEVAPSDNRIIIPRIDQNIPIVRISSESLIRRDWDKLEDEMQNALKNGVVHYPGTSLPGQTGNIVITGHSSYFPWDSGRYKDVFAILYEVVEGDNIVIYYEQDKYVYEVTEIKIVMPEDIEILKQTPENKLTLITCYPVGTNLKRLVVTAKPIEENSQEVENKVAR
jgi:LPXTG-site transpeptidase (sortase) family protein